ncbi:MAG: ureidoglycolate lyase [Xanthomonadales bacterium]
MKTHRLNLKPLTQEAFAPFGDVIQTQGHHPEEINCGQTRKYAGLARLDVADEEGTATVHIYRSRPIRLPFRVEVMEYHPLSSQAFIPLHRRPFLVIVAPAAEILPFKSIQGFFTNGEQGVNLNKGVWHHNQLSLLEICDYLVIERDGPGVNTIEQHLEKALFIQAFMQQLPKEF